MCFSSPSVPAVQTVADTTSTTPQQTDEATVAARQNERQRRLAASGQNSTLVTGGMGASGTASTGLKTAFGA